MEAKKNANVLDKCLICGENSQECKYISKDARENIKNILNRMKEIPSTQSYDRRAIRICVLIQV